MLFDLFGTLARPAPPEPLREIVEAAGLELPDELWPVVANGCPPAMLLPEMNCSFEDMAPYHLTTGILSSVETLVTWVLANVPGAREPPPGRVELAERVTTYCVEEASLFEDVVSVLDELKSRHVSMSVVSDVSAPFGATVQRLRLGRWFETIHLSFVTGARKKGGSAFRSLSRPDVRTHMIGDSWSSDVLGAVAAGLDAVLVDRDGGHPGRILLSSPALLLDPAEALRVVDEFVPWVVSLTGATADALRQRPDEQFDVSSTEVSWRQAPRVRVCDSLQDVPGVVGLA